MQKNDYVLRISLTSNCNLNCFYCKSKESKNQKMISFEELKEIIKSAVNAGIRKISWTGGEPTVRSDFVQLVAEAKKLGIEKQTVTTNGIILFKYVAKLKEAGINRFNVSLDTLDKKNFKERNGGNMDNVIKSLNECVSLYDNTKVNCVVTKDNIEEINNFIDLCESYDGKLTVRFLELVPCGEAFGHNSSMFKEEFVPVQKIIELLEKRGKLIPLRNEGHVPKSKYFKINGLKGIYGVNPNLSADYHCDKEKCPKIRLNPTGYISNCTIDLKYVRKISGEAFENKQRIMFEIVKEKKCRDYKGFRHKQRYYEFWRFGIKSDEVAKNIGEKN